MSETSGERPGVERTLEKLDERERDELARTWQLAAMAADPELDPISVKSALARFSSAIESADVGPNGRLPDREPWARRSSGRRRTRAFMAAVVVAVAGLLAVVLWPRTTTVTVPPGEIADETLPDGSHVVLSASTTLSYRTGPFADARRVQLDGEAYFSVSEDDRTFRVETFNATVTALGTSFNVRAVEESRMPSTRVALAVGVVRLGAHGGDEVWLKAGEMSEVDRSGMPSTPREVSIEAETSWRTGGFAVLEQPLVVAMDELERRFGVAIELGSDYLGQDTPPITIDLPSAPTAEVVLGDLCAAIGCRYRAHAGGFLVEPGS